VKRSIERGEKVAAEFQSTAVAEGGEVTEMGNGPAMSGGQTNAQLRLSARNTREL